jgi:CubicO group peptidase (beta-lactamase class C family)
MNRVVRHCGAYVTLLVVLVACTVLDPAPALRRGVSAERLDVLTRFMQSRIDAGHLPGMVMVVMRDGKVVYSKALGLRDPKTREPMTEDTLFRMYSMTKPVVSVAAMMLVEEGRLDLTDPVSRYIPELKNVKVGIEKPGPDGKPILELVAAKRQMTIRDLMRHTAGFTYGGQGSLVEQEYEKRLKDISDADDFVKKVAALPLVHEPGSKWEYSISHDVLGIVIERISGKPLQQFLAERIFRPLKMEDTDFWVDPAKQHRIAEPFEIDPDTKRPINLANPRKRTALAGGGGSTFVGSGMICTARDYLRFAQMLLNGGELDGVRLLSRKSVELIASDHLRGIARPAGMSETVGWGLGVLVRNTTGGATLGTVGDYSWGGFGGTSFVVDPGERLIALRLSQAPASRSYYNRVFRNMVYSALE